MSSLLGHIPLFPLPQGALLPTELLPLHIFEPRYRRMMEVVRGKDRLLAIATLLPGWDSDERGALGIAPVVGVGRVVRDRLNRDGTSDIVLRGISRAEVDEEHVGEPFRQATLRLHRDTRLHPAIAFRLRRRLLDGLAEHLPGQLLTRDVTADVDAGHLVDCIAAVLEFTPGQRVQFLHALDPELRVMALLETLAQGDHSASLTKLIPSLTDFGLSLADPKDSSP